MILVILINVADTTKTIYRDKAIFGVTVLKDVLYVKTKRFYLPNPKYEQLTFDEAMTK